MDPDERDRLASFVGEHLRRDTMSAPAPYESEPTFTARVVTPLVKATLEELNVKGCIVTGDGGAPQPPVPVMGFRFFPDVGVSYQRSRVLAVEVKFLRNPFAQYALATALGQAVIYRTAAGYPRSMAFLVDQRSDSSGNRKSTWDSPSLPNGVDLIVRRVEGDRLLSGPRPEAV